MTDLCMVLEALMSVGREAFVTFGLSGQASVLSTEALSAGRCRLGEEEGPADPFCP